MFSVICILSFFTFCNSPGVPGMFINNHDYKEHKNNIEISGCDITPTRSKLDASQQCSQNSTCNGFYKANNSFYLCQRINNSSSYLLTGIKYWLRTWDTTTFQLNTEINTTPLTIEAQTSDTNSLETSTAGPLMKTVLTSSETTSTSEESLETTPTIQVTAYSNPFGKK